MRGSLAEYALEALAPAYAARRVPTAKGEGHSPSCLIGSILNP